MNIHIYRRILVGMTASAAAFIMVAAGAGCGSVDVKPVTDSVGGTAVGLLEPVSLELRYTGGTELLTVTQDGPFAFETTLSEGDSYTVQFVGDPSCALGGSTGILTDVPAVVSLTCEGVVRLTDLVLDGATAPDLGFAPDQLTYQAEVSVLHQRAVVIATTAFDDASVSVQGTAATSGTPSAPVPLGPGDNVVAIDVTHPSGLARTYELTVSRGGTVAQYAYGKASNTGNGDYFGVSVDIDGDTLAVGAYLEDSAATGINGDQADDSVSNSGAVYIFRRTGSDWVQEAYIKASNTEAGDYFGLSVDIDGDTLAVGAYNEDSAATGINGDQADNTAANSGAVYIFTRTGTEWQQQAYIKASNTAASDYFGRSVALSGDTLAVGAYGEDSAATGIGGNQNDNAASSSGAVYVFTRTGTDWQQQAYIKASNTEASDYFGLSLSLYGDTLAVGAYLEDSAATGIGGNQADNTASSAGAVFMFRRTGTEWQQQAYIKASNAEASDYFGLSVDVHGDLLAVSAYGEDSAATGVGGNQADNTATSSGAAYIFRYTGTQWQQEAYIKASNAGTSDSFGLSVALDGDTVAVGAYGEDSAATGINGNQGDDSAATSGAVYVYRYIGTQWQQDAYIKASNTDAGDYFGGRVALSSDALAVGAYREASAATAINGNEDDNTAADSGAVYIFH